ncbi:E3 ubiquitin-protein ligase BRE1 [Spathaspora passalidarum NRRL Y-27907]|uniref:E3 ubiquitin protein ligase n=1 Tax=Spathaspora passalidarum (strain NRRL Y-27907 / 11-Y1) TaxID=619300 RepID=G3AND6_SPAPN|nr:E3 ubiquitin-protein ligase BRE1 [Spathaspora passalidarum NRRL Y-27907]EGW31925.1 E3 ubiquitin-protein ligase BRE1 [Spathaspora passalidarum NRRL Y-27907]
MSKRPSESSTPNPSSPPLKRAKPLQELSDSGPLTQEDVVYFQKEAIWRQMTSYREQVNQLRSEISKLQQDASKSNKVVKVLIGWYDQIISLCDNNDGSSNHNLLLIFDEGDDKLEQKREQLNKILTSKILLAEEDMKKLEVISQKLASSTAFNQQLTQENGALQARLDASKDKVLQLTKEIHRLQSKSLKRAQGIKEETPVPEKESSAQPEVKQEANGSDDSKKQAESTDNQDELVKLAGEVEELKTANTILTNQLEELTQSYQLSTQRALELEHKLHNLEETDLESNIHYKKIVKNNQSLQEQIGKLSKLNAANIAKLNEFEKQQNSIKAIIEKEILEENDSLKSQLAKSEQDLVRIRTARDDLISKNSILTSQLQDQKTNQELLDLNKALAARIESLTESKLNEISGSPGLAELSPPELISKIQQLNNDIKEIELAFKETREVSLKKLESAIDSESLIKKLTIEKTKADQKYFASMRVKDSLTNENKVLKVQVAKSQELIKNLNELEKNYLNKIEILTKSLNDYKIIKENSLQENQKLQDTIKSLSIAKESLETEISRSKEKLVAQANEVANLSNDFNKQKLEINKLEKSLKSTESILQKYKTNNTSSLLEEDEQQIEALRSIAKCSVCSKNWKDTAITVCGHVFCSNCTQERLAARLRRCPSCNKGFSANDLLAIHL